MITPAQPDFHHGGKKNDVGPTGNDILLAYAPAMSWKTIGLRAAQVALAIILNVTMALLVFFLVKQYCKPPVEGWLGLAMWLIPVFAHFFYLREMGILLKLLVSIAGVAVTLAGALTIALAVFGDAP